MLRNCAELRGQHLDLINKTFETLGKRSSRSSGMICCWKYRRKIGLGYFPIQDLLSILIYKITDKSYNEKSQY